MMIAISTMHETQSQFGKVEEGRLNESLLYKKISFTVMMSRGWGYTINKAMPKLSPLKI